MRIEKHYLVWGSDISTDCNLYEAGLGFCVAADKLAGKIDCVGGAALRAIRHEGVKRRLCWFTTTGDVPMYGGEALLQGDRVVGSVTSADYGFTVGRNFFAAWLAREDMEAREFTVEICGERHAARRHDRPLYDPERKAILR